MKELFELDEQGQIIPCEVQRSEEDEFLIESEQNTGKKIPRLLISGPVHVLI